MSYEVRMIDNLMYGIWEINKSKWLEDGHGQIIHSPNKDFLEKSYIVNLAAT